MDSQRHDPTVSRREWGRRCAAATVAGVASQGLLARSFAAGDDPPLEMIVRNERPLNLETPVELLDSWLTPTDRFFVRSHFGPPSLALRPWSIQFEGLVRNPGAVELATIRNAAESERVKLAAVLQCAGNGRGWHEPTVPGVPWQRGAVGQAEWGGVRLRTLLERAGILNNVKHVHFYGADPPPHIKTPAFIRSLPIERALHDSVLLATEMNGEPLPALHGGPVRLVVPGWTGNHWMKWVKAIVPSEEEAPGSYQRTGYKMPVRDMRPDETPRPDELVPVTDMNVKSLITAPGHDVKLNPGVRKVRGVAWTGSDATVDLVEVSINEGPWMPTVLENGGKLYEWRQWSFVWTATAGSYRIRARARDTRGRVQPERTAWNKSGYLWNGIDTVAVEVADQ